MNKLSLLIGIVFSVVGGVASIFVLAFWVRGEVERIVNIMKLNFLFGCRRERKLERLTEALQKFEEEMGIEGEIMEEVEEDLKFEDLKKLEDMESANFKPSSFF